MHAPPGRCVRAQAVKTERPLLTSRWCPRNVTFELIPQEVPASMKMAPSRVGRVPGESRGLARISRNLPRTLPTARRGPPHSVRFPASFWGDSSGARIVQHRVRTTTEFLEIRPEWGRQHHEARKRRRSSRKAQVQLGCVDRGQLRGIFTWGCFRASFKAFLYLASDEADTWAATWQQHVSDMAAAIEAACQEQQHVSSMAATWESHARDMSPSLLKLGISPRIHPRQAGPKTRVEIMGPKSGGAGRLNKIGGTRLDRPWIWGIRDTCALR